MSSNTAIIDDVQLSARRIFSVIAPELALVEAELERQARSSVQIIAHLNEYLCQREARGFARRCCCLRRAPLAAMLPGTAW